MQFSHLHNHTQYSLLDGASKIPALLDKAVKDNMPAVAITDHGNMFGVFEFVAQANKRNIKPIIGCEFYVVEDHHRKSFTKIEKDKRYHQLLLAKNPNGYKNLSKLCSLGYTEGLYSKYPRVTKELIDQYKDDLIATTCCIGATIPQVILHSGEKAAEEELKWWLDRFEDDFYVEIQRHDIPDQIKVNEVLLRFAQKYNIKTIASNDSHYIEQDDWESHDILLCVNTNEKQSTPKIKDFDDKGSKNGRFAFFNDQFYFKTTQEMSTLFSDIPEAIDNTNEIVDKISPIELKKDILLPNFPIPDEYKIHSDDKENQWEFLKFITYEGAKKRYGEISSEAQERIDFELFTIKTMGFAGYFLIVMDFIEAGRKLDVMIGPGRGSAAGSVVAYCIGITNIDPLKYNLLFERFLNPDRKSMPDIDTDFDDEGRQKVIDYVVDKYGQNQVAQIITYGTMATKSAIKDVARVMELPLSESNMISKMVPDKPSYGMNFQKLIHMPMEGEKSLKKLSMQDDELKNVQLIRDMYNGNDLTSKVLRQAERLEGTVRGTGIHAAGIIIAPKDLSEILPVSTSKDSTLLITQYEGKIVEDAGVIKMDFLGLKNLSIIKEALKLIKQNHGVSIEIDEISLEDEKTYKLFQNGETNGIFQFESDGMKKHLKDLKPDRFEDLIAMNALYRPGPIEFIPNFINRKHGREEIEYDLPETEEYLGETFGITVYQEQLMLLAQKLGNLSKGDADVLRKAMGKKQLDVLNGLKGKFLKGCEANGLDLEICESIWKKWEKFAEYAFNKSHSTCYAFVAYQTAYLKAHYTAEYMAALLTSQLGSIDKITFFMEECKRLGLNVLGPDVNESDRAFAVNENGEIRFGLAGIKGAGDSAVDALITERQENGKYSDIFDFIKRVNLRTVNKKTLESLVFAGGFDNLDEIHRAGYIEEINNSSFLEKLIKYANQYHEDKASMQNSLFGDMGAGLGDIAKPKVDQIEPWGNIKRLRYEKEVVGFYISGHPLDQFSIEMKHFCKPLEGLLELSNMDRDLAIGGMVTDVQIRQTKNGKPFAIFKFEDYDSSIEMALFGNDFINFSNFIVEGVFLYIRGKVQAKWGRENDLEFKPVEMVLLQDVLEKKIKGVLISFELNEITEDKISQLKTLAEEYAGTYSMTIKVVDKEQKIDLELFSRSTHLALNKEVFTQLELIAGKGRVKLQK